METNITTGSKVVVTLMDSEEGFPYKEHGTVTTDWEKINYDKKVDIKLDRGDNVIMYPKYLLKLQP